MLGCPPRRHGGARRATEKSNPNEISGVAVLRGSPWPSVSPWRTATLVLLLLSTLARQSAAQQPRDSARTTRAGVYTAAQADRGADVYAGMCRSCHSAASHTGVTFAKWWKGRTLADLFGYVSERMPKNDPGSLAPEQYADVVAYLLRLNAMPPGRAELAPDSAALAAIRIDVNDPAAAAPAPVRKDPRRRR
jgi:S-disulfanyl-L-cysteine oxidoreductase SoxD